MSVKKIILSIKNKKASYEYSIMKEYMAGVIMLGAEVKSVFVNGANIQDSYCFVFNNEVFLKNCFIPKYKNSTWLNHDELREKKLLLKKSEINQISKYVKERGITLIPLEMMYVNKKIRIKIGVCKGKKIYDKREDLKKKDIEREVNIGF
jgi:SsrA-binding protein